MIVAAIIVMPVLLAVIATYFIISNIQRHEQMKERAELEHLQALRAIEVAKAWAALEKGETEPPKPRLPAVPEKMDMRHMRFANGHEAACRCSQCQMLDEYVSRGVRYRAWHDDRA